MQRERPTIVIFRHGSNACNQSMCNRELVAIVIGTTSYDKAKEVASKHVDCHCYNNQYLTGKALSHLNSEELEELQVFYEEDAAAMAYGDEKDSTTFIL